MWVPSKPVIPATCGAPLCLHGSIAICTERAILRAWFDLIDYRFKTPVYTQRGNLCKHHKPAGKMKTEARCWTTPAFTCCNYRILFLVDCLVRYLSLSIVCSICLFSLLWWESGLYTPWRPCGHMCSSLQPPQLDCVLLYWLTTTQKMYQAPQ